MNEQWEVSKEYGDEIVIAGTNHLIIELLGARFAGEEYIVPVEVQKRAALVAAAPDLLRALDKALEWAAGYPLGGSSMDDHAATVVYETAAAAIKKARRE
jgi:hypothetical protein